MTRWVLRGGSFYDVARSLRTSDRYWDPPENRDRFGGFRLVVRRAE